MIKCIALAVVCLAGAQASCPQCENFEAHAAAAGVPVFTPVCAVDGVTYANECEAALCSDTIAVCAGACPCPDNTDPFSDSCPSVPFPREGHQDGPFAAYAVSNVSWPAECCAICDADPACASYTWTSIFFSDDEDATAQCLLYSSTMYWYPEAEMDTYHPFCFSGNKLPLASCPVCDTFETDAADAGVPVDTPVCAADGHTYANECEAALCGNTIAVCAGACPCPDEMDPFADSCPSATFPQAGHQTGPDGAYAMLENVSWPVECCAECDADPACASYTWTSAFFFFGEFTSQCFLYEDSVDPEAEDGLYHEFCFSGNKLPATDYYEGASLPQYWKDVANAVGVDIAQLAFNVTEQMWYYAGTATCIGWGEFDDTCDFDEMVCSGYSGRTFGYGVLQMTEIKNMLDVGKTAHELCPSCPAAPAGQVYVCHDGVKYSMPSGAVQADFGLPGHMSLTGKGIWMTCDCEEVHRGYALVEGTYWWTKAVEAGLDAEKVSHLNGVWYYDGKFSCVAKGSAIDPCDTAGTGMQELVCAGSTGATKGYGAQQMYELYEASLLPTGEHAYCPLP